MFPAQLGGQVLRQGWGGHVQACRGRRVIFLGLGGIEDQGLA
jgi:hypothetical protein